MNSAWRFSDPEQSLVITLERILRAESPILLVTHDLDDGGWQFLDGEQVFEEDGVAVGLAEMVQLDPSLEELADLPVGWHAWRAAAGMPWQRTLGDSPGEAGPRGAMRSPGATNIEIKARVGDLEQLQSAIEAVSETEVEILDQEDIFYAAPSGRLKLRILGANAGELIHYHRPDAPEPRASHYQIAPTTAPDVLASILGDVLPIVGVVKKKRRLYRVGQSRIHLDQVDRLGAFVEIEVVLGPGQTEEEGFAIARELCTRLGIAPEQFVPAAYIDLLREVPSPGALPGDDPA